MAPSNIGKLAEEKEALKSRCKKIEVIIIRGETFHSFSRLPIELRLQIWKLALPAPVTYYHSKEGIWYEVSFNHQIRPYFYTRKLIDNSILEVACSQSNKKFPRDRPLLRVSRWKLARATSPPYPKHHTLLFRSTCLPYEPTNQENLGHIWVL